LYEVVGIYEVTLTVIDNDEQTMSDTVTVIVKDTPLDKSSSGGSIAWL
jgi:PKD repeat protein